MLESKAKDLSLIRLRNDLARYAPELLTRYGIDETQAAEDVGEVIEMEGELSVQDLGS
jgi:UV DNA damage endonuclease